MASIDGAIEKFCMENNFRMSGRNAGVSLANKDLEPSTYDLDELTKYFAAESIDFEQLAKWRCKAVWCQKAWQYRYIRFYHLLYNA